MARKELSGLSVLGSLTLDGAGVYTTADFLLSDIARRSGGNSFTGSQSFNNDLSVSKAGSPTLRLDTTENSSEQANLVMTGARTTTSATIAQLDFFNNLSGGAVNAAQILVDGDGDINVSVGQLLVAGGTVWHENNDGAGSGLDADLLDGSEAAAFARLTGATFTGTVNATYFSGPGGGLTNVNASLLGGQSASAYALLSGSIFTGTVQAAGFTGPGAGITGVVKPGEDVTLKSLLITDADNAISWENGINWINGNDGGGNAQIRFGNNHGDLNGGGTDEVFTHAGTAFYIGGNLDSGGGTLQLKVASNGGAGVGEAVAWGPTLSIGASALTWNGVDLATTADLTNIAAGTGDFIVTQTNGGVTNLIWWDGSADTLFLGTAGSGGGKVSMRAPLEAPEGFGVGGASPDATNVFALYGTDMLLNSGGSINMKFNKNATGNDASLTFQSAFSTQALVGLLANNDLTFKVGSSFTTAMILSNADATVSFPEGIRSDTVTAYKTTNQTITSTAAPVTAYDGTHIAASGNLSFSTTNGDAYVGKAGRFLVCYSVSTEVSSGSGRTDSTITLQKWNGSAWSGVAGSVQRMYNRLAGRGGTCASWQGIIDAEASDGFRLVAVVEDGTDTVFIDNATFSIMRL